MKPIIQSFLLSLAAIFLISASLAVAQEREDYRKLSIDITGSVLKSLGETHQWTYPEYGSSVSLLYQHAGLFGAHFGYRPIRYFQIDAGFELGANVVGTRTDNIYGSETHEYRNLILFLPVGGRAVLPLVSEHLLLSIGGGGAYLNSFEYSDINWEIGSREGWGVYGIGQVLYVFGESRRIGAGFTSRWYRAHLSSGVLPGLKVLDNWISLGATLSIRL